MAAPAVGEKVPAFTAEATSGEISSKSLGGEPFVLYFYPKDGTPGCSMEAQDFRDRHADFAALGVRILGVSRDGSTSHEQFRKKYDLPFELVADPGERLCKQFDVIREKHMYGKKVLGIERSTFLVDGAGRLRNEWRKVTVKGHVEEVLKAAKAL